MSAAKVYSYPHKLRANEHIEINGADTTLLMKIPGIGSYYASRIVRYRERLGGFASAQQLEEIDGFWQMMHLSLDCCLWSLVGKSQEHRSAFPESGT